MTQCSTEVRLSEIGVQLIMLENEINQSLEQKARLKDRLLKAAQEYEAACNRVDEANRKLQEVLRRRIV